MLAVYGTVTACVGLLIFFGMLSVIRRPGAAAWLRLRLVREGTVFASMLVLLAGLGSCAQFFTMKVRPPLSITEILLVVASLLATSAIIWKIRRPVPPEDMPAPVLGFDSGPMGPQASIRKTAA